MSDLVEAARGWLNELKELDIQLSPAQELIAAMADEIERLEKDVENLEGSLRNVRQATLDDMREFEKTYNTWPTSPSEFLDAYEKARK